MKRICGALCVIICVIAVILPGGDIEGNPHKKKNKAGLIYWHGDTKHNEISLTFDDGPNEPYTSQVLDALKRHGIRATFFLIGKYVDSHPEIARRITREGHVIGNHTYSHPDLRFESRQSIASQIKDAENAIVRATGKRPYLFRPPYGGHSLTITQEAEKAGYVIIEYSASGADGDKTRISSERIVKTVLSRAQNGSIILLHDGDSYAQNANRASTVEAVPVIIESLHKEGYQFVTIPKLLHLDNNKK